MTSNFCKTSTAMLMALSLTQPGPLRAQDLILDGAICADRTAPPCPEGVDLILADGRVVPAAELPEDLVVPGAASAEAEAEALAEREAAAAAAEADAKAAAEAAAAEAAAAEAEAEAAAKAAEAAEAAAEAEAAAAAEAAAEAEAAAAEAEAKAAADAAAAAEAAAAEAEAAAAAEAEAKAAANAAAAAEAAAAEAEAKAAAEARAAEAAEAAAEAEAEAAEAAEAEAEKAAAAGRTEAATAPPAEPGVAKVIEGSEGRQEEAQRVFDLLGLGGDADADAEPPVAAAAKDEAAPTAIVETEITEEGSRQSSEDFATTAAGAPRAERSRGGLSDFEKAALVGLGILAVGAILANGDEVVANTGDRVVMRRGADDYYVLKDDDALLRQPGSSVRTETFSDGSTRTVVTREDGSRVVTIRDAAGRVVRRVREDRDGSETVLIDDSVYYEPVDLSELPPPAREEVTLRGTDDPLALALALERASARGIGRSFSLRQIRDIEAVRKLVPEINFGAITFETGSAAIDPSQAAKLLDLADLILALLDENPGEMFLIEGHTDAVGSAAFNLALSDRRAESLALALTEYFFVPPENMVVQGYGESDLKVDTDEAERANRRVAVRRITPLLDQRLVRN